MNQVLDALAQTDALLSIITVTRNDADRLSRTIQSLSQFYDDARFEHLVMDGVSTDRTTDIVAPLARTGNFQFHSESDKGIYDAMNKGIKKSKGRFLLFLNCGDCMLARPDDIAAALEIIGSKKTVDITCFSFTQIESGGAEKTIAPRQARPYQMPTSHQAMVFSADFTRVQHYDTRYKIAADYDLYIRARSITIAPLKQPITAVEVDGVASSQPLISYREYLLIVSRNLQGANMLVCMTRIGFKALIVIALKSLLPKTWIRKLRRMS